MNKQFDKKRLMYSKSDDLYFITYNIILILYHLNCTNKEKPFKDYRKLVFLIPIIADQKITTILLDYYKEKNSPNRNILGEMNRLYYDSLENLVLIRYVLMILESKNIITLVNDENKTNVYINNIEECKSLVSNIRFEKETQRILKIKKGINRLSTINYMTFVENFFKRNGVAIWEN